MPDRRPMKKVTLDDLEHLYNSCEQFAEAMEVEHAKATYYREVAAEGVVAIRAMHDRVKLETTARQAMQRHICDVAQAMREQVDDKGDHDPVLDHFADVLDGGTDWDGATVH